MKKIIIRLLSFLSILNASATPVIDITEKIQPICVEYSPLEDLGDPEYEITVEDIVEQAPTSPFEQELRDYIRNVSITRQVRKIVWHCTATRQNATITAIQKYWRETLGWVNPGYHIIISADGSWTLLHDFNKISNGVKGLNSYIINISYIGGIDTNGKALDNRTPEQKETMRIMFESFSAKLPLASHHGHNEFSNKACPSFSVKTWVNSLLAA
jgi:N-acetylmuramoyl-L-alanine amidase